jgi:hypothetical protein
VLSRVVALPVQLGGFLAAAGPRRFDGEIEDERVVALSIVAVERFDDGFVSFIPTAESTTGQGKTVLARVSKAGPRPLRGLRF